MPDRSVTPAVVLGCYAHGGLAAARTLGRLGVPVHCVDADWATPAFFSAYCRERVRWNLHDSPSAQTLDVLRALGKRIGRPAVLIPTGDAGAIFVADHADQLRDSFLFPDISPDLIRSLCSKEEMYHLARKHGVATPETAFPKSRSDVLAYLETARFPILIKPISGALPGRPAPQIAKIENEKDLLARYDALEDPASPNLMLQEFVPGGDDFDLDLQRIFRSDRRLRARAHGPQDPQLSGGLRTGVIGTLPLQPLCRGDHDPLHARDRISRLPRRRLSA